MSARGSNDGGRVGRFPKENYGGGGGGDDDDHFTIEPDGSDWDDDSLGEYLPSGLSSPSFKREQQCNDIKSVGKQRGDGGTLQNDVKIATDKATAGSSNHEAVLSLSHSEKDNDDGSHGTTLPSAYTTPSKSWDTNTSATKEDRTGISTKQTSREKSTQCGVSQRKRPPSSPPASSVSSVSSTSLRLSDSSPVAPKKRRLLDAHKPTKMKPEGTLQSTGLVGGFGWELGDKKDGGDGPPISVSSTKKLPISVVAIPSDQTISCADSDINRDRGEYDLPHSSGSNGE